MNFLESAKLNVSVWLCRFESLSVQQRIKALTTTFPYYVSKIVEAFNEMRDHHQTLPQYKRNMTEAGAGGYAHSNSGSALSYGGGQDMA